ncbi:MAG: glycoside hydrolase family 88 protein [Treponema sp.]|jgi:unsaturated rhamnogalacturonyl hydrolase|nr:glycoside hydrolase family 88 protein [Treponema sp.]
MAGINMNGPISVRMAQSVMNRYEKAQMLWHYEHGLVLQSIFHLGLKTGNEEFCSYVKTMYDEKITPSGDILSYKENEYNLDQINPGKVLFLLYSKYGEEKYKIAIEKLREQLCKHPRTKSGGYWHKLIYPWQMWLDGLYMQAPFYTEYAFKYSTGAEFANSLKDIGHQFSIIESKARDEKTGLLYHAWDESRQQKWANPDTGCSPHFWGRALGWYCMAIVDVLEIIQPSKALCEEVFEALCGITQRLIDPLINFQDAQSGLWYQVLDKGQEAGNYTESSASSMYVYFMTKMLRLGLIEENKINIVKKSAYTGYQGLLNLKLQEELSSDGTQSQLHLNDICFVAGLGGNPYRDGSYEYYIGEPKGADDFKGVGPFILASMEQEALNS